MKKVDCTLSSRPQASVLLLVLLFGGGMEEQSVAGQIVLSSSSSTTATTSTRLGGSIRQLFYGVPPAQAFLSTPQMIEYNNFPVEEHKVQTKDGYILTLFRIPYGKNQIEIGANDIKNRSQPIGKGRRPIVLQHGLLSSSDDWLVLPSDVALPYLLAENNFDVWLSNYRGNNYSLGHTSLSPDDPKFWDFCYDEISEFDVPAIIEYVLNVTKFDQLNWVGHSSGNTVAIGALSDKPELNKKIHKMVAMALSVYIGKPRSPVARIPSRIPPRILEAYFSIVTGGPFIHPRAARLLRSYAPFLCFGEIPRILCNHIIGLIGGVNREQITRETASLVFGHWPSSTSGKLYRQIIQVEKAGKVQKFDYGPVGNEEKYGTEEPLVLNLSHVQVPIMVMYGLNDILLSPEIVKKSINALPTVEKSVEIADPKWGHLDFLYGKDAKFYVYDFILNYFMEKN